MGYSVAVRASPSKLDVRLLVFRGPPYTGRIEDLPKRLQNAYNKRREENLLHHQLSSVAADAEARVHVSRMLYIEQQRRANKAAQMKMFDAAPRAKGVSS